MTFRVRIAWVVVLMGLLAVGPGSLPATASAEPCPNEQLRAEQGDQHLPDCRAYELVTPSDKGATTPMLAHAPRTSVAPNGDRVYLASFASFGENPAPGGVDAVMSRAPSGWTLTSLQPHGAGETSYEPNTASPNLTIFGVETVLQRQLFGSFLYENTFAVGPAGGPYTPIASTVSEPAFDPEKRDFLSGMAEDGSSAVLSSTNHTLTPGATNTITSAHDLYDWSRASGTLSLINVTNAGSLLNPCGAELGSAANKARSGTAPFMNPMSSDGSKIFFTTPDNELYENSEASCQEPHRLYMRVNGMETVEISAPQPGVVDPTGTHNAEFIGATLDGTHVWFLSEQELTADDTGHALQLYEYNTVTRKLMRVSRGEPGTTEGSFFDIRTTEAPELIAFSENGSILYFLSASKLTTEPSAASGIYRYETATGALRYVGDLGQPMDASRTGDALVFQAGSNIYHWSVADPRLICVSCVGSVSGSAHLLPAETFFTERFSNNVLDYLVSDEGRYVFFSDYRALVPQDTTSTEENNNQSYLVSEDVYEWESQGTGSCTNPEGCVSLISVPDSGHGSRYIGMSADGHDAFFET